MLRSRLGRARPQCIRSWPSNQRLPSFSPWLPACSLLRAQGRGSVLALDIGPARLAALRDMAARQRHGGCVRTLAMDLVAFADEKAAMRQQAAAAAAVEGAAIDGAAGGDAWGQANAPAEEPQHLRQRTLWPRVLLDAPCSGTGVLAKRADLRWRKQAADVAQMAALQAQLLDAAAGLVQPGGLLVYSTCSLEPAENQEQVGVRGGWRAGGPWMACPQVPPAAPRAPAPAPSTFALPARPPAHPPNPAPFDSTGGCPPVQAATLPSSWLEPRLPCPSSAPLCSTGGRLPAAPPRVLSGAAAGVGGRAGAVPDPRRLPGHAAARARHRRRVCGAAAARCGGRVSGSGRPGAWRVPGGRSL